MLNLISQRKIKNNWEFYKKHIIRALGDTYGDKLDQGLKVIFGKLMSPFKPDMHLWTNEEYLILTNISVCEFTQRKSLMLYTFTRINWKQIENIKTEEDLKKYKVEVFKVYKDFYDITAKFAKDNDCYELVAFTPLDYIARMSRAVQKDSSIMYFINYNI